MDEDRTKDGSTRRFGISWGGDSRHLNLVSDRWHDSFTSHGPDWIRGPIPAVRDYGPSYEVTTIWGKILVVAAALAILIAMFVL